MKNILICVFEKKRQLLGQDLYEILDSLNNRRGRSSLELFSAFDTVEPNLLLKKLDWDGVGDVSLRLLESYVTDRDRYVAKDGN